MTTNAPLRDAGDGRWIVAASVLGSGAVFLEGTVVNVALPTIGDDFALGVAGLQWVLNGYLLTLSALILLGGALGDRYRRRTVFVVGLFGFAATSIACALAPTVGVLLACRALQGAAGALVVPNSLAMLETAFAGEARGVAIGRWAAWSAASTALGPLLGGWLVDAGSWRWVFASIVPFALGGAWLAWRHAPADDPTPSTARGTADADTPRVDYAGAALATLGLGALVGGLIVGPDGGFGRPLVLAALGGGAACLAAFAVVEHRVAAPLLPLAVFRSRQFSGANAVTLFVYAALGGLFFLLMLQLQNVLGYDPLAAGAALLPVNGLMLLGSSRAGRLAERIGARWPMTIGALLAGAGMALFARVQPGTSYLGAVLPAAVVFGLGLATLVAPLTAAVLAAVDDTLAGVASAVNTAVARLAGLLATAAIPLAAGLGGLDALDGPALAAGFTRAMWISAGLCAAGALVAALTVRDATGSR